MKIPDLPLDNPIFLLFVVLIGIVLLIGLVKIAGWAFAGLMAVGYLVAGIALASTFCWSFFKTKDQTLAIASLAGLALLVLIALVTRKSKSS